MRPALLRLPTGARGQPWRSTLAMAAGLLVALLVMQPALRAHRETSRELASLRDELAKRYSAGPDVLDQAAQARAQVGIPQFYRLPSAGSPEVQAHTRATVFVTQVLEIIRATGGTVLQVGLEAPQRLPARIRVPGGVVWRGDFKGVRQVVAAARSLSPKVGWRHCKLLPEDLVDEPESGAAPKNWLRVELGFVAEFDRTDGKSP